MGLLSGLFSLFGCGMNKDKEPKTQQDSTNVQTININDALFTIPTINNALPEFKEKTDTCVFFHEDEWRQIEFISKDQKPLIDQEISKIKDIYDNHSHKGDGYMGFKEIAVRDKITQPLRLDFTKLKSYLTDKPIEILGLGLENNEGQVRNGFYFTIDGIGYYGVLEHNFVTAFCIYSTESDEQLKAATTRLSKLLEMENLFLVDWRSMLVFDETSIKTDI